MNDQQKVVIGQVSSPHGIKGWLKVYSYTDPIENIFSYKSIFIKNDDQYLPYKIEDYSSDGKIIRIKLSGVDDRNQSEELSKCEISINRGDLPDISSDSYYWADLLGFKVKSEDNLIFGVLDSFFETGSNDVMVVVDNSKNRKLIPFINGDVVKTVLCKEKIIIVDWSAEE